MATTFWALGTATVSSATPSITFSGIPATYRHLWVMGLLGSDQTGGVSLVMRPNNLVSNYNYSDIWTGSNVANPTQYNAGNGSLGLGDAYMFNSSGNNTWTAVEVVIPNYRGAWKWNTYVFHTSSQRNQTTATLGAAWGGVTQQSTSAISSITFLPGSGNFTTGSKLTLYGLA